MSSPVAVQDDWQSGKGFPDTNLIMLTDQIACDVIFLVGNGRVRVKGHKFMLVSRSCVFLAMFCGPMAEKDEVEIPDVEVDIFNCFLRYMYSGDVCLDPDNVMGLLYTAKKYSVKSLELRCLDFLESALTWSNACEILEQAHVYSEDDLWQKALKVILIKGKDVLGSSGFPDICKSCLNKIISSDDLRADEMSVFRAALTWAEAECNRQGKETTPEVRCEVLGDSMKYIRFPLISWKSVEVPPGFRLTNRDSFPGFEPIDSVGNRSPREISSVKPRKSVPCCVQRFDKEEENVGWTFSQNRSDAITFSCDLPVELHGFTLYGPFRSTEENEIVSYSIVCCIEEELRQDFESPTFFSGGNILEGSSFERTVTVHSQDEIIETFFEKSLRLLADIKYTVVVSVKGPDSRRGCQGRTTLFQNGVCWTFHSSPKSKNSTDVEHGQIPGFIYSVRS